MIRNTVLLGALLSLVACGGKKDTAAPDSEGPPPAAEEAAPAAEEAAPATSPAATEPAETAPEESAEGEDDEPDLGEYMGEDEEEIGATQVI